MLRSPTLQTLTVFVVVFLAQAVVSVVAGAAAVAGLFVLEAPVDVRPWTLVTSVYAHGGFGHLLANGLALLVVGFLVERRTSTARFHLFFVAVGMLAGAAEVTLGSLAGQPRGVLGASGAVFGLLGYLLAGNVVTATLFERVELSGRAQLLLFVVIAVVVTAATGAPGVALLAHFTGLLLGLAAGRLRLLDTPSHTAA